MRDGRSRCAEYGLIPSMLDEKRIHEIAFRVAADNLTPNFSSVISGSAVDHEGHEILRITIVIGPDAISKIDGDTALNTLVQMQDQLQREGEERFAVIDYATQEELADSGDP
jgi:hypothetical protein